MIRKTVSNCLGILAVFATVAMLAFAPAIDGHEQFEVSAVGSSLGTDFANAAHDSTDVGPQLADSHCHIGLACTAIPIEAAGLMPRDPDQDAIRVPAASRMTGIAADHLYPPPRRTL